MTKKEYLDLHHGRKKDLIERLTKCASLLREIGDVAHADELENLVLQTRQGKFSIVVVGAFSAGKSTMLNALMGERLLPSFTKETTATINFLESAEDCTEGKELIRVNYMDGHSEEVTPVNLENLQKYGSTEGLNVAKTIDSINIYVKGSKFLKDGVRLVDSPGLNGIAEGHTEKTQHQINESHAAIYVFSAHQSSGTESDFKFLKDLKNRCHSLFIVLNQIDLIKSHESSVQTVVEDLKGNFHKMFPDEPLPEIYPISAYGALVYRSKTDMMYNNEHRSPEFKKKLYEQSRIETFEDRLMKYLVNGEKTIQELTAPIDKAINFINSTIESLTNEIDILSDDNNLEEVKKRKEMVTHELRNINKELLSQQSKLREEFTNLLDDAVADLQTVTRKIADDYISKIDKESDIEELSMRAHSYVNRINAEYQTVYHDTISKLNKGFLKIVRNTLQSLTAEVQSRINSIKIRENDDDQVKIKLDESIFEVDLDLSSIYDEMDQNRSDKGDIEDELDILEVKIVRAERDESRANALDENMRNDELYARQCRENLGLRPQMERVTVYRKERTGGLWGGIKWLFNGNPPRTVEDYVEDYSAQQAYDQRREEIEKDLQAKRADYESRRASINIERDSAELITERTRKERRLKEIENKYERLEEKLNKEVEKQKNRLARQAKLYLSDLIDKLNSESRKLLIDRIQEFDSKLTEEALVITKANLSEALAEKEAQLAECERLLSSANEEKEQRRKLIETQIESLNNMIQETQMLKSEFDGIDRDEIEIENL